jgi:hypothetical protein
VRHTCAREMPSLEQRDASQVVAQPLDFRALYCSLPSAAGGEHERARQPKSTVTIERVLLRQEIAHRIMLLITEGQIHPGTAPPGAGVGSEAWCEPSSVREALRALQIMRGQKCVKVKAPS